MRAIAYFCLKEPTPAALAEAEFTFRRFCSHDMHQPHRVFFSEGPTPGYGDPDFQRMTDFLESSDSEFLVTIPDATHLGGDLESIARSIVEIHRHGAALKCWDIDYPNPFQNVMNTEGIKGVFPRRARQLRQAMEARALEGGALGRAPFGYRAGAGGKLQPQPEEAVVVELIFRLYTRDDMGFRLIAQELNERGIATRSGGAWNAVSVRGIVRNRSYVGASGNSGIRKAGVHEPIVPLEVFNEAAKRLRQRRPVGRIMNPKPFLLSGFAYCGYCGDKMMGVTRRQSWRRKDDRKRVTGVYRYYQCQARNNKGSCDYHTWKEDALEREALTKVKYRALARAMGLEEDAGQEKRRSEVANLRLERVKNAERLLKRAMRRAAKGEVGPREVGEYLAAVDSARRGLRRGLQATDVIATLDRWASLDHDERKDFLWEHVGRIIVRDDDVAVEV